MVKLQDDDVRCFMTINYQMQYPVVKIRLYFIIKSAHYSFRICLSFIGYFNGYSFYVCDHSVAKNLINRMILDVSRMGNAKHVVIGNGPIWRPGVGGKDSSVG